MAAAKLIGWGGRVLYLGPAFGLTPHRNATAVLAVGLDAPLEVADDPADRMTHYRAARSVLILPNSLHHLRIERGRMAFLYVDPLGRDLKALIARMTNITPRAAFDLREESGVIEIMTGLAESRLAARDGRASLGELLGVGTRGKTSARIAAALQHMRDEPQRAHRLTTWRRAPACRRRVSSICSRPRRACRCGATASGTGWARRFAPAARAPR